MEPEIQYWKNGNKHLERYFKNNNLHRLDGPAHISYYKNENKHYEEYWINGVLHRLNGPAYISYNINGNITNEIYCVNGNEIPQNEIDKLLEQCDNDKQLLHDLLTLRYS